jgi:hypothetical protein
LSLGSWDEREKESAECTKKCKRAKWLTQRFLSLYYIFFASSKF